MNNNKRVRLQLSYDLLVKLLRLPEGTEILASREIPSQNPAAYSDKCEVLIVHSSLPEVLWGDHVPMTNPKSLSDYDEFLSSFKLKVWGLE